MQTKEKYSSKKNKNYTQFKFVHRAICIESRIQFQKHLQKFNVKVNCVTITNFIIKLSRTMCFVMEIGGKSDWKKKKWNKWIQIENFFVVYFCWCNSMNVYGKKVKQSWWYLWVAHEKEWVNKTFADHS